MLMNYSRFCNQMLIIFFFGVSFSSPQQGNEFYSESWALLIGINKYHNETHLNYAVADAERMHRLLTEKLDFPADNVFMLLDEEATLINIKKEMKKLYEVANDSDRVLIYFAGHGITESLPKGGEEGYLIPIEGDKDDLYTTALPMSEMKRISKRVSAKDMLFLMDACYSGLMGVGNRGLSLDESANISLRKIAAGGSRTVITAGRKGEIAQENAEWGHSPFVKNLVSGLEKGMADLNDDNYITGSELGMYLTNQVTADTDNKQTPDVSYFTTDRGEFVFIIGDINLKLEDSKLTSSPSLEIDYDKLAEKIADRMESKKSSQIEQNDEEVEETRNMDLLEKEMWQLSEEMTALGEEMTELGEEMEDFEGQDEDAHGKKQFFRNQDGLSSLSIESDLTKSLAGMDAVVLAVPHSEYLTLDPDEMVKLVGRPFAVIDCFCILEDDVIRRYIELGCEVKGLGRGHIKRIKDSVAQAKN